MRKEIRCVLVVVVLNGSRDAEEYKSEVGGMSGCEF